jgi:hypothetical protein
MHSAQAIFRKPAESTTVTIMLRKVVDGVYWIEGPDGTPVGLTTTSDDGTSLKAVECWWSPIRAIAEWISTPAAREWFASHGVPYLPNEASGD